MSLSKEAAIYLATMCERNPSQNDWKNAIRVIAARKGQKLSPQELGKAVMEAQFQFKDGIDDDFLARELPKPKVLEEIEEEVSRKEKDVQRKSRRSRSSRRK